MIDFKGDEIMRSLKKSVLLPAVSIGLVVVFILFGPLGMTAAAQAAPDTLVVTFTGASPIQYQDLGGSGNPIGEGLLVGELLCVGENCNQKIEFEPVASQATADTVVYEYKFKSRLAFDPVAGTVVVAGTGTIASGGPKMRFSFTGIFQDNGDGTVLVNYNALRPDASFLFPAVPGTFSVFSNN